MTNETGLFVRKRIITSPFGLLGSDENALTFALAYTFQRSPSFLKWFLNKVGVTGVRISSLRNVRIDLQRYQTTGSVPGITDIEIHLKGCLHVVVEAKIRLGIPSIDQCQKYLPRFESTNEPVQKLVTVVQSADTTFIDNYAGKDERLRRRLVGFSWPQIFSECVRLMHRDSTTPSSKEWIRALYNFLDQEYHMEAFTTEVWLLPINTKPHWNGGMSYWDIHTKYNLYFDAKHPTVRPLYIAFRVHGKVDAIHRVHRIQHSIPIIDLVPELANVRKSWPRKPYTIWHFGPPVKLAKPIRTGGGMFNRRVRCDLDLLLTCDSVQEIEMQMSKRRGHQPVE